MIHLLQSTMCIGIAWLLTLALRNHRAATRYRIWLAAAVKFLIPLSLLVRAGGHLGWQVSTRASTAVEALSGPLGLSRAPLPPALSSSTHVPAIILGVWLCGFAVAVTTWARAWRRMRQTLHGATRLTVDAPIPVMSAAGHFELGVFGIWRPVLLLPAGITEQLTPSQLEAIIAHELCRVRRRDNLAGAIHMTVEAIFWFHPLVWWLSGRLIEERERACDEEVLQLGYDPEVYAEGILRTCRLYLGSARMWVAGVTGAALRKRIEAIAARRIGRELEFGKKLALAMIGIAAVAVPVGVGISTSPRLLAQTEIGLQSLWRRYYIFLVPFFIHTSANGQRDQ